VIACPHALGLAIPLVVAISTSITARNGILIKDRKAFEDAKGVNAVVFDKTGTLTTGQFGVKDVVSFISEEDLLSSTAAVEQNSEHIIFKAIVKQVETKGIAIPKSQSFEAIPGKVPRRKLTAKKSMSEAQAY
jgi:Cu2+-exporting ATPase